MKQTIALMGLMLSLCVGQVMGQENAMSRRISLDYENAQLESVLRLIAQQNHLNLVLSSEITGRISVRLDNVSIATALETILTSHEYAFYQHDDVIVVKRAEDFGPRELRSREVTLKYLNPLSALKAVQPRLSEKGDVVVLDGAVDNKPAETGYSPNRILITDYPNMLDELTQFVVRLDVPERVVRIEARIIETKIDHLMRLGLKWPGSLVGTVDTNTYDINKDNWTWGILSVNQVDVLLDMLKEQGNARLISDPRLTTNENYEAVIKFETIIPIQTISRFTEGASTSDVVTFEDEEVGVSLKVTPRINEDGRITLDVEPRVEDIIDYVGPEGFQKPITSARTIKTRITVSDGETVVLGGLLKDNEIEIKKKLPVLGDIPILGGLFFTHRSVEKETSDLTIMITPHVLE